MGRKLLYFVWHEIQGVYIHVGENCMDALLYITPALQPQHSLIPTSFNNSIPEVIHVYVHVYTCSLYYETVSYLNVSLVVFL